MKRVILWLGLGLILTGCYTQYNFQPRTNLPTSILAVTAQGDTVQVPYSTFTYSYPQNPAYYNGYYFYWDGRWMPSHTYYTTYRSLFYPPYRYPVYRYEKYVYRDSPSIDKKKPVYKDKPKPESKPRSTGATSRTRESTSRERKRNN